MIDIIGIDIEGRVIQLFERNLEDTYRLRWGVGRLIAEAKKVCFSIFYIF